MPIKAKLENKDGKIEDRPGLDINKGYCDFPFVYKDEEYDEKCYKGKRGDWCSTDTNPGTKTVAKWAYCDYEEKKSNSKDDKPLPKKIKLKIKKSTKSEPKPKSKTLSKKESEEDIEESSTKVDFSKIPKDFIIPKSEQVKPAYYQLPNRKAFVNWFDSTYGKYRVKKGTKFEKTARFSYFNHQKIIRDYINKDSPFRGLLLYHGLGVGKTCGSIAIAEGFKSDRKVIVMLNKSLRQNFRDNLRFCGFDYFRTNQHWFFHKYNEKGPDNMKAYARSLGITIKRELKGSWFIDFSKKPNYEDLTKEQQKQVDSQINEMIDKRYMFINMDGLNEKRLKKYIDDKEFDNAILVIDEVHNLTNAMAKAKPGIRARYLEKLIMEADNLKLVFLSGTPMINNLFETAKMFNLLRGYITSYNVTLTKKSAQGFNWNTIANSLKTNKIIDQYFVSKRNSTITLSRVKRGFIKTSRGFETSADGNTYTDAEFLDYVRSIFPADSAIEKKNYTAFPNDESEFTNLFYDEVKNQIKNTELFKSRILGLVSYYRTQDKSLIPTVTSNELIEVPMSDYQFLNYAKVRKAEIEQDKNRKRNQKKPSKSKSKKSVDPEADIFDAKSSYRAYSRMHCSFVFPPTIPRPYPTDENGDIIEEIEGAESLEIDFTDIPEDLQESIELKRRMQKYEQAKDKTLKKLDAEKDEFLVKDDPEKLLKLSPKYNTILSTISETKGLAFIYTEYKTLEGIAVLSIVLKANGYAPFILKKNDSGEYYQDYEHPDDKDKPKYAFWGGGKAEESDLIRRIYNNDFEELPKSLRDSLKKSGKNNLYGDIIKILLTTKTGAEGIDLHNVRQVHIVEPYWNPVRLKQVKGRAVRVGSHLQLPEAERTVDIFTYLSVIPPALLKTDRVIEMDSKGQTSDQALYNLSQKKLAVMETLLRLIKEASVDCSINFNDTYDAEEPFVCQNYGSNPARDDYSFVPDIKNQYEDKEQDRRTEKTTWTPKIVKLKIKGVPKSFALKPAPDDKPQLLYDLELLRESGRPGMPVGEIIIEDGKKKVKFYAKSQVVASGVSKINRKKSRKASKRKQSRKRQKTKKKTKTLFNRLLNMI